MYHEGLLFISRNTSKPPVLFSPLDIRILLKIGTKYSTEDKIEARIARNA